MRASLEDVGLNPATLPQARTAMPDGVKPWRDIWSAGHSVALIDEVAPVSAIIDRLAAEFGAAYGGDWRKRLQRLT
jgi:nitronate monooxygenase